jgi:hypothetical protein
MQHPLDDSQDTQIFEADDGGAFEIPTDSIEEARVAAQIRVAHALLYFSGCWTAEAAAPLQPPIFPERPKCENALSFIFLLVWLAARRSPAAS